MLFDELRSFQAVAKYLSFREAASELHLTESAVSKRLNSLQRTLGVKLYTRSRSGIALTEAGWLALTKIEAILNQVDDLIDTFRRQVHQEKEPVVLSVGGGYSLGAEILRRMIRRFEKSHAGVEVKFQLGSSQQVHDMIREGRAEIGLSPYPPSVEDVVSEPFCLQTLVFFVNPRHPLASRRKLKLSDLVGYPLVTRGMMGGPTWTYDVLKALSERGFKYKVALECHGPAQVRESVAQNIGVGLTYLDNLKSNRDSRRFVVLKGADFRFTTLSFILYSKKRVLSAVAGEFLALLRQAKRLPDRKSFDKITGPLRERVRDFLESSQTPVWMLIGMVFWP